MRHALIPLVALAGLALAGPAHAEDAMQKVFEKGRNAHREGRFAEAKALYREVIAKGGDVHAVAVCNLGGVERDLKEWVDAATHLADCLRLPGLDKDRAGVIAKALDAVRQEVVTVRVDGVPKGETLRVVFGQWGATLGEGREFFVGADVETEVELFVQGKSQKRKVRGAKAASVTVTWTVGAGPGGNNGGGGSPGPGPAPEAPSAGMGWKLPVAITTTALGVIGVGVGAALIGLSASKDSEGDKLRDELVASGLCPSVDTAKCEQLLVIRRDQDNFFNAGLPILITGSVLTVAGVVMAVVPMGKPKTAAKVELNLGLGSIGVRGRF